MFCSMPPDHEGMCDGTMYSHHRDAVPTRSYDLHAHIEAERPELLANTLRRIANHLDDEHDFDTSSDDPVVVDTHYAGAEGRPSWSVRVTHETETVDA